MREIKFRAWNTAGKRMRVTGMGINGGILTHEDEDVIMQNIGLKDKNGKEIYEGDILLLAYAGLQIKKMGIVKWHDDTASFCIYIQDGIASMSKGVQSRQDEIIGDIYRNPALFHTLRNLEKELKSE